MDTLHRLLVDFRRDRSAAAMEEIVRATRPRLLAVARRIGREDAEDSVQAAYHALLARPEAPSVAVLPWLLATVVRIAYRRKAIARREARIAERLARPATPLEEASRAEVAALVRREVARLPARYRDPVVLYYIECLSVTEVGTLLDIPPSTVTTQLQRARLLLRARLSPTLLHSVMVVPWFLADHMVPVGGVMKAKAWILVTGVVVATGTIGVVVGMSQRPAAVQGTRRAAMERPAAAALEARDEEIAELRRRVAELQGVQGGAGDAPKADASAPAHAPGLSPLQRASQVAQNPLKPGLDFEKSRAAAAKLGVPDEALEAVRQAYLSVINHADPALQKEALDALRAVGDVRTVAVAAFLQGLESGPYTDTSCVRRLLEVACVPGQEHFIVDLLKDATSPASIKTAILDNADAMGTEVMRDYLLDRFGREEDRYMASSIVMALGRMREPRAVAACVDALQKGGDWRPFEPYSLFALGEIGGHAAETALLAYIDGPDPAAVGDAVRALAKIDAAVARSRAEALLDDPSRRLGARDREILLELAGRAAR